MTTQMLLSRRPRNSNSPRGGVSQWTPSSERAWQMKRASVTLCGSTGRVEYQRTNSEVSGSISKPPWLASVEPHGSVKTFTGLSGCLSSRWNRRTDAAAGVDVVVVDEEHPSTFP